jgi:hypothetical protein
MSKTLIITSTAGLLLCAGFLGLANAIGGDDIFHDTRTLGEMKPLIDLATQKAWRWNGGDTLALDAPINIRYQPRGSGSPQGLPQGGPQISVPQISVSGPAEVLQHMRVSGSRIAADTNISRASGRQVEATVNVPIRKFVVNGGENLDLGEVDQPALDLHLNGSGTVTGRGKVDRLNLVIAGSSKADLGGLSVMGDSNISILGSGDATLSPHGKVKLFVAGSGNLELLSKPSELRQTIVGSGEVRQLAGDTAKNALKAIDVSRMAREAARESAHPYRYDYSYGYNYSYNHRDERSGQPGMPPVPPQPPMAGADAKDGTVTVHGSNDTDLGHIEQPQLSVTVTSSGSVTAEGKVDRLNVNVLGSGHAQLGKLAARSVSVMVMGSGDVTVAPGDELKATIMGSGDVHLLTRPARIQRSIMGSGHIIEEH